MSTDRYFCQADAERLDELGFLDVGRSPPLRRTQDLLAGPVGWVLGRPWIGKSTVARELFRRLRAAPSILAGAGHRVALTRLGDADAGRTVPPEWWHPWVAEPTPTPAVWLIDG